LAQANGGLDRTTKSTHQNEENLTVKIKNNTPFQVVVNGQTFDAEVENLAAIPLVVTVNGTPYTVELVESGSPVVTSAPAPAPVQVAAPAAPVRAAAPSSSTVLTADGFAIQAPMPGTIQGVCVKVGQAVKFGDQLCLLEAMKMKNAIRTSKDGVVVSIEVQDGQKVPYGALLFTLK
jgi:glutaconyl-CoA/methylmalonyl-CoA decarboxylase subunit gamma